MKIILIALLVISLLCMLLSKRHNTEQFDNKFDTYNDDKTKNIGYKRNKPFPTVDYDTNKQYMQDSCRKPIINNPFMNPTLIDFNNDLTPNLAACNAFDEEIKNEIADKFNKNLFRNVDDLFEIKNSQRQFYTIPNTSVPNQQIEFAEWLWKQPETCKEDQSVCLRYEDLRFKR